MRQQIDQKINEANHKKAKKRHIGLMNWQKKIEVRQHKEIKCYLFEGIYVLSYFTIYCLT